MGMSMGIVISIGMSIGMDMAIGLARLFGIEDRIELIRQSIAGKGDLMRGDLLAFDQVTGRQPGDGFG